MIADETPLARRPSLARAIVGAVPLAAEHAFAFIGASVAWGAIVALYLLLVLGVPALLLALPALAIPTSALMRLAVVAARLGVPTLRIAADELKRVPLRKLGVASVEVVVLAMSVGNVAVSSRIGGVAGAVAGAVGVYAALVVAIVAIALWPILCDPRRASPLREQVRLAATIALRRPAQLAVLALLAAAAAYASVALIAPAVFLPPIVLIAVAGYVVPLADETLPLPPAA